MLAVLRLRYICVLLLVCTIYVPQRVYCRTLNNNERSSLSVSKGLLENWGMWFHSIDADNNGVLTVADRNIIRDNFIANNNMSSEEESDLIYDVDFCWKALIFKGNNSKELSKDEFIESLRRDYLDNYKEFRSYILLFKEILHGLVDVDEDWKIPREEFFKTYQAFNLNDTALIEDYFNAYHPIQGKVSVKRISREWADFLSGDGTSDNIIKTYLSKLLNY